ncbi:MAG: hypothetical protein HY791_30225 [Deltaproteobacteria bacterium]|nr:hypothetical protein [Deltaproteobacteria bacterium]
MLPILLDLLLTGAAPTMGMNGHLPSPDDSVSMAALGTRIVRMDFNWFDFQPEPDRFEWGYLDLVVDGATQQGLEIYATVAYTPAWASSLPSCGLDSGDESTWCGNKPPADPAAWAAAVREVVARYRGRVACWGIWNEPNLRTFFDGSIDTFVDGVFRPAVLAIRGADPAAKICGPELSHLTQSSNWNGRNGTCIFGNCIRNGWELDLGQMLERVGAELDVVTHHVYKGDAPGVMQALLEGETTLGVLVHDSVKNVIDSKGYGHKDFWLTEVGWEHPPQGGTSLDDVATRAVELYSFQEQACAGEYVASTHDPWPVWVRTFYYHFPYDPGSGWGLVDLGQAPLPAYSALQAWAQGRTTTTCIGFVPDGGVLDASVSDGSSPDASLLDAGFTEDATPADAPEPDSAGLDALSSDATSPTRDDATIPRVGDAGLTQDVADFDDAGAVAQAGPGGESSCACRAARPPHSKRSGLSGLLLVTLGLGGCRALARRASETRNATRQLDRPVKRMSLRSAGDPPGSTARASGPPRR